MVLDYVKEIAGKQMNLMMKKMDLRGKMQGLIKSDAIKGLTD